MIELNLPKHDPEEEDLLDLRTIHLEEMKEAFVVILKTFKIGLARKKYGYYPRELVLVKNEQD